MGSIRMRCSMADIMDNTTDITGITAAVMVVDTIAMEAVVVVGDYWAVLRVS